MENPDKELNELRQENYRLRRCLGLMGVVPRAPIATIEEAVSRIVRDELEHDYAALLVKVDQVTRQAYDNSPFNRHEGDYFHARRQGSNDLIRTLRAALDLPALDP